MAAASGLNCQGSGLPTQQRKTAIAMIVAIGYVAGSCGGGIVRSIYEALCMSDPREAVAKAGRAGEA